ncbi:hypothetical protein D9M69_403180 [compost metagenome]
MAQATEGVPQGFQSLGLVGTHEGLERKAFRPDEPCNHLLEFFQAKQGRQDIALDTASVLGTQQRKLLKAVTVYETTRPTDAWFDRKLVRSHQQELVPVISPCDVLPNLGLTPRRLLDVSSGAELQRLAQGRFTTAIGCIENIFQLAEAD